MFDIGLLGQDHISNGALVLVVTIGVEGDFFPKGEVRGSLPRSLAEGVVFLWAINAVEADTRRVLVVQDFEDVAVEDASNSAAPATV